VVYELWVRAFGREALVLWKWALVAGTFTLLFVTLRRRTGESTASFLACFAAAATAAPFLDIRPHLYTLLGLVLLVRLTLDRERPSWLLPGVFLVWANLHGGFFFGLLALGLLLLPSFVFGDRPARKRATLIVATSTLAALVNPNGIHAFTYPLRYAFDKTSPFRELGEWRPPFEAGGIPAPLFPFLIGLFAVAAVACFLTRELRRDRAWLLAALALGGLTLAMALRSRRFIPLFAISQTLVLAPALARGLAPLARFVPPLVTPILILALAVFRLAPYPLGPRAFTYLTAEESFPVDTCDFMEANRLEGRVFAYYNWAATHPGAPEAEGVHRRPRRYRVRRRNLQALPASPRPRAGLRRGHRSLGCRLRALGTPRRPDRTPPRDRPLATLVRRRGLGASRA
jgi:hypothetical protein